MARRRHSETHLSHRSGWLRAAILGANDGIVSTASLVLGVAASGASGSAIVTAGIAGLAAGALSMAAGEYVSVSSQRDSERADLTLERKELRRDPEGELRELAGIYESRGLQPELANRVAQALTDSDALEAHAREELGLTEERQARPFQGALRALAEQRVAEPAQARPGHRQRRADQAAGGQTHQTGRERRLADPDQAGPHPAPPGRRVGHRIGRRESALPPGYYRP